MNVIENVNRFSDFVEDKLHHASNELFSLFFFLLAWYAGIHGILSHTKNN